MSLLRKLFWSVINLFSFLGKLFLLVLPALLVLVVMFQPEIKRNRGIPIITDSQEGSVHEIFPNTRWGNLKPCGVYFNEKKEFDAALQCVNDKVWPETPLVDSNVVPMVPPRCFVVTTESPDIFTTNDGTFNFVPVVSIFGAGLVLGVYEPETRTVFIVENLDAAMVYRHELQHVFLHYHDPDSMGGGHFQPIWDKCEPPYYTPSLKAKVAGTLKEIKKKKEEN